MENTPFYIVTRYGCGDTANELLTPESKLFTNFDKAYKYFLDSSPELVGGYKTTRYVDIDFDKYNTRIQRGEYIIIESRVQIAGYYDEERNCARSPYGVVIIRCIPE